MNVFRIFGHKPISASLNPTIQPMVSGSINEDTIVMAPTIETVGEGSNIVVHGVIVEGESVAADSGIHIVVTNSAGGQVDTCAIGAVGDVAIPTTIVERV